MAHHLDDFHEHPHDHAHPHEGERDDGFLSWVLSALHLDGHTHPNWGADRAFLASDLGIRAIWLALGLLLVTGVVQVWIVYTSGSVALMADTVHNLGDGLNSVPLLVAFYLGRKAANKRYTYGYGRAEDIAGIFIVLSIAFSAGVVFWQSYQKLFNPQPITHLGWLAFASLVGFVGNELVAVIQIRVGKRIGSAALVLDGLHARTDGLTSLAVLAAAGGVRLGMDILDPLIGFGIGVVIVIITIDAAKTIWWRLMDAVDPHLVEKVESLVEVYPGVGGVCQARMRWVGQGLYLELALKAQAGTTLDQSNQIVRNLEVYLREQIENLTEVQIRFLPV